MKRIKYYLASIATGALLLSSCSDSFWDINDNPNSPAEVTVDLSLPAAQAGSMYVIGGYYHALGSYWSQHYAQAPAASQWGDWESYNLSDAAFDRQFSVMYSSALMEYEYCRTVAAKDGNWTYYTLATLMQAYTYKTLVDLYDQIPFTEALKGTANLQPHYDNGAVVYDSLFARIDDAVAKDFNASSNKVVGLSDLIFRGSLTKWIQFANTLKLQMYLRYVNVDSLTTDGNRYKQEILDLLAENNFLSEDAAYSVFKDQESGWNPFFSTFVDRLASNVVANSTLMDYLKTNGDPRLNTLFNKSTTGLLYKSVATGNSKNLTGETNKNYSEPIMTGLTPVYFFTKEEVLFMIAEAQERYGTRAAAEAAFNAAVLASFTSQGLASTAITYPYTGLSSIMEQKWVAATNKRAIESFFDYSRTGYPTNLSTSVTSVFVGSLKPKRLFYPQIERQNNKNTPAKESLTKPVWWGK